MEENIMIVGQTKQHSIYMLQWYVNNYSQNIKKHYRAKLVLRNDKVIIAETINNGNRYLGRRDFIELYAEQFELYVLKQQLQQYKQQIDDLVKWLEDTIDEDGLDEIETNKLLSKLKERNEE